MTEPDRGGLHRRPPSPEEVAREFIQREGSFELFDDVPLAIHRRWWIVAAASILVVAIAAGVIGDVKGIGPFRSKDAPSEVAQAQTSANRLAVGAGCPANPKARVNNLSYSAPSSVIQPSTLYAATVTTTTGTFRLGLNVKDPQTLNSFVFLAQQGFFDCNTFFRVKTGVSNLTGDPTGTGKGGPGYNVALETPPPATNQYPLGSLVLDNDPSSGVGGSQWFIVAGTEGEALPNRYTLFGRVISGMSVVEKINAEGSKSGKPKVIQRILRVTIQTATV